MVVVTKWESMARIHGKTFSSRPCILVTVSGTPPPKQAKARAALWPYFHEGGKYLAERGEQLICIHASHPAIS